MSMLDRSIARKWASNSSFLECIGRWTWFRAELPAAIASGAARAAVPVESIRVDSEVLAKAFLQWASLIESVRDFEAIDREDFAHFACGCLLHEWLQAGTPLLPQAPREDRIEALTRTAVTVLDAWRTHAGADQLVDGVPYPQTPRWNSYVENCLEDSALAVPFLDEFTGREPVWEAPLAIEIRPAMRRAAAGSRA
jgi:hypothetical protein